jgi:hypothetical protein
MSRSLVRLHPNPILVPRLSCCVHNAIQRAAYISLASNSDSKDHQSEPPTPSRSKPVSPQHKIKASKRQSWYGNRIIYSNKPSLIPWARRLSLGAPTLALSNGMYAVYSSNDYYMATSSIDIFICAFQQILLLLNADDARP